MAGHEELIGQVVGDYRLLRWLGGGGFGHVYLAEPARGGSQVAIKELQMRLTQHEDFRTFLNEARMIRLKHPHIMPLLDFGLSDDDMPFLVMEYAPRGTLRQRHPKGSRIPLSTAIPYATQMASALQYAHEAGLIHCDVKPENMLLRSDDALLLSDLGIATIAHSMRSVNTTSSNWSTMPYMAPEQLDGTPCAQSDQYALAVVIYEWLIGRCPFQGSAVEIIMQHATKAPPSLRKQVPGLPQAVENVLFKALAKDPKERFASMQDFAEALQQANPPQVNRTIFAPTRKTPPVTEQKIAPKPTGTLLPLPITPPPLPITPPNTVPPSVNQSATTVPDQPGAYSSTGTPSPLPIRPLPLSLPNTTQLSSFTRKLAFSKGRTPVMIAAILGLIVLIAGGSLAYPALQNYEAHVHVMATVTAESNMYNKAVARDGVMFGFNAQHTRNNPYERLLSPANVAQLQQRWTALLDGPPLSTAPTIANGLIYIGAFDGQLYAFDANTDQQKWSAPTGNGIAGSAAPTVANGLVYIGSEDEKLYACDALTGQQKWSAPTGGSIISSPAVANDLVYIGSDDGKLYAFNATTGKQKWVATTGNAIGSSPTIANSLVYIGSNDDKLYAFDALTGQEKWAASTGSAIQSSPAVANGLVYVGSYDNKLYAFNAATGQQEWVAATGNYINSTPVVANGLVYVGSEDDKLYAFDALTGQEKWEAPTSNPIVNSPAVANGLVYVNSYLGKLYAFDAITGQQKWVAHTGNIFDATPAVSNGLIYIGSTAHKLYAFDATTGQQKWVSPPIGNQIGSSPAIVNGFVYVGSDNGKLYAFSLAGIGL